MNFIAPSPSPGRSGDEVASGRLVALQAAGDTYISLLVTVLEMEDQLKIQKIALEHARERATKRDHAGVQIGLAVLCAAAEDIRKIAAAANAKLMGDQ